MCTNRCKSCSSRGDQKYKDMCKVCSYMYNTKHEKMVAVDVCNVEDVDIKYYNVNRRRHV